MVSNLISKALDDIRKMKECKGHEWIGPIKTARDYKGKVLWYTVLCKFCPLGKVFNTMEEAQAAIEGGASWKLG